MYYVSLLHSGTFGLDCMEVFMKEYEMWSSGLKMQSLWITGKSSLRVVFLLYIQ